jgi:Uma2 family endonuclease
MNDPGKDPTPKYTCKDHASWKDAQRWQLVGGEAYLMSPGPTSRHQSITMELARQLANHFRGKTCRVFGAPLDVRLSEVDVFQPDLMVVCHPEQIRSGHIQGPPSLVVEVLSPASAWLDRCEKLEAYARAGVQEYWLVTPWPSLVEVLALDAGKYRVERVCRKEDTLVSVAFPELQVTLADVFDFPPEPGERLPIVREEGVDYSAFTAPACAP